MDQSSEMETFEESSSQQVCGILNATPGALRQAKRSLRQRFGLKGEDSFEDFLRALVKQ
ncbi:MAG: hypothetical protein K2K45_00645 [Muribaculaceae bacterium]|nr:hypothetical protein [Muribaculaceae bacterium]